MGYSPWVCKRVGHDLETKQHYLPCIVLRDLHGLSHFISLETNETGMFIFLPHTGESQRGWEMCTGTLSLGGVIMGRVITFLTMILCCFFKEELTG